MIVVQAAWTSVLFWWAKNWFRVLGRVLSEGSAGVCVFVAGECLDPLPHMPGVFAVKVLLDALFVFALGLFDVFLQ